MKEFVDMSVGEGFYQDFIWKVEMGQLGLDDLTSSWHPKYFQLAIKNCNTVFIEKLLDFYDVPRDDLSLKQRIALYQLGLEL